MQEEQEGEEAEQNAVRDLGGQTQTVVIVEAARDSLRPPERDPAPRRRSLLRMNPWSPARDMNS